MRFGPLNMASDEARLPVGDIARLGEEWRFALENEGRSRESLKLRAIVIEKLCWFLERVGAASCGTRELQEFLSYIRHGHESREGRWGNPNLRKAPRPSTVKTYDAILRAFFAWLVDQGAVAASPLTFKRVQASLDQLNPFEPEQVEDLLAAARSSRQPLRDTAILMLLLDTGMRASELCGLTPKNLNLKQQTCLVTGKGNKTRPLAFGSDTRRALEQYLPKEDRQKTTALFTAGRGPYAGKPLTRSGLLQLLERLGREAELNGVRCSPHTCRHYFAVQFLKAGGNTFALQMILGHTNLAMTRRYVALVHADTTRAQQRFSPMDRLQEALKD